MAKAEFKPRRKLLDPDVLARMSRLELVARQAVEGFLSGKHPSPYHGSSVEYADHRPYTIGDEISKIDWKILARTDKHYVKLFEEQTNARATILLDMSRSMAFSGEAKNKKNPTISKYEYGAFLASAIAYLMLQQNDAVGLVTFDSKVREYVPGRTTASHFRRMIDVMQNATLKDETTIAPILHEMAGRLPGRGLIILISDLIDDVDTIADGLAHFRYERNDVIVFHIVDPDELEFPYQRMTRFRDMEGGGTIIANAQTVRAKYLERMQEFLTQVRGVCHERDVSYELARTDTPYEQLLTAYLHQRSRLTR